MISSREAALCCANFFGRLVRGRGRIATGAAKQETAMGKFLDEAAVLQFGEHLQEDVAVTFFHLEGAREVLDGDRVVSKLKKTKDIVEIQVGGARHNKALSGSDKGTVRIVVDF